MHLHERAPVLTRIAPNGMSGSFERDAQAYRSNALELPQVWPTSARSNWSRFLEVLSLRALRRISSVDPPCRAARHAPADCPFYGS